MVHINQNCVDVNYQIYIQDKKSNIASELKETHKMRYLFKPEIEMFLNESGFDLIGFEEWETGVVPSENSWGVCCIAKRNNR